MKVMSDSRKIQTNKVEQVEAFHSMTVAVFCRGGYLKCHTFLGVDNTV